MNYAEQDKARMLQYIKTQGNECNVDELFRLNSIEKLRIYSLIYRMRDEGILSIIEYGWLGAPQRIKLN